ncbi:MAG: malto-oligosyltrehalose trehalohydrolase [Vicinamibacterales bacterium]
MVRPWTPALGAHVVGGATRFRVWAPEAGLVAVITETPGRARREEPLQAENDGFHGAVVEGVSAGERYRYRLDGGQLLPDPASRYQPEGVHGPSAVVDWRSFPWSDGAWTGLPLEETVLYELHVGTFTPEGTFAAAADRLPDLKDLGVTAIELMPVADFPGRWNWGYDGVAPFAPARCYGHPDDLRRLVDAAHRLGLAVHLDVVYNHLGPDGAYQSAFSRDYYSAAHTSPWGAAMNFDGPRSQPVRDYVVENGLHWVHEYHIDGLRLDATHAIVDQSPRHILAVFAASIRESLEGSSRRVQVVAEDHGNLAHMIRPEASGGFGLDALWSDDFHHQMRRRLAGDADGYFADFSGTAQAIARTAERGWFYCGEHSDYFGRRRGTDPTGIPASRFVFFLQNHDQVGNRAFGDRLHARGDWAAWKAASTLLLVLPETPLLFMGQEWAASSPFQYFTDHHPELGRLVRDGRRREFSRFAAFADQAVRERIPDPQSEATFLASRLAWDERAREPHASVRRLYADLLALRRREPTIGGAADSRLEIAADDDGSLLVRRRAQGGPDWLIVVRLAGSGTADLGRHRLAAPPATGSWTVTLTTEDPLYETDPSPITVGAGCDTVSFRRPGAVILRAGDRRVAEIRP